jgi:hypothetical protein
MARKCTLRKLDRAEELDMIHRTNPVAAHAFKTGNAAGFHGRDENKISRRETRKQEQLAARGIFEDDEIDLWADETWVE